MEQVSQVGRRHNDPRVAETSLADLLDVQPLRGTLHGEVYTVDEDNIFEVIRTRAYQLWVEHGRPEGCAAQHWCQAEDDVRAIRSVASVGDIAKL